MMKDIALKLFSGNGGALSEVGRARVREMKEYVKANGRANDHGWICLIDGFTLLVDTRDVLMVKNLIFMFYVDGDERSPLINHEVEGVWDYSPEDKAKHTYYLDVLYRIEKERA